ncbi:MAG: hypothetical protein JOY80_02005 [Candidatus Dormibacteraeota bacterium]|nr:hypothetical protein [Candidatus Dormibacteraeota bacterium]
MVVLRGADWYEAGAVSRRVVDRFSRLVLGHELPSSHDVIRVGWAVSPLDGTSSIELIAAAVQHRIARETRPTSEPIATGVLDRLDST